MELPNLSRWGAGVVSEAAEKSKQTWREVGDNSSVLPPSKKDLRQLLCNICNIKTTKTASKQKLKARNRNHRKRKVT